jgi:hypothetical protein
MISPRYKQKWDMLAEFQTIHFTKCLKELCDSWAHCIKAHDDYFEGNNIDYEVSVVVIEK